MAEEKAPRKSMRMLELQAGLFVVLLAGIGIAVLFVLSAERHVFERQIVLHAPFNEIQGLKEGAPVRVSGVNVGNVSRIHFMIVDGKPRVQVDLRIMRQLAPQIRGDSIARIDTQGLLGDKLVEISAGSPSQPPLRPGATIITQAPTDLDKLLADAGQAIERIKHVADRAASAIENIADEKTTANMRAAIGSLRQLLSAAERGPGLAHALFYDKNTATQFHELAGRVNTLATHVDEGVSRIDNILDATDDHGRQIVNNFSLVARRLATTLDDVHRSKVVHNLERATGDLAFLTAYTRSGKGTIGGALIDPVVYEQLISILGGVERSRTLRALVRFAIKKDDKGKKKEPPVLEAPRRK